VKVLLSLINRFERLAYPKPVNVRTQELLGCKNHDCREGEKNFDGRNNLCGEQTQGPKHKRISAASKIGSPSRNCLMEQVVSRLSVLLRKANGLCEETVKCSIDATVVWD